MAKKGFAGKAIHQPVAAAPAVAVGRLPALLDTRIVYCGDNLEQLARLPDACVDLISIDQSFNSNRAIEPVGEVFSGETKENRSFEDRQAYIEYMRPRCVQLARVLKKTGSSYSPGLL